MGLVIAAGVFLVVSAVGFVRSDRWRIRRALLAAPHLPLAEAGTAPDIATPVGVSGKVVLIESVVSPFSGRPCAYYEILVEQATPDELGWTRRIHEVDGTPFLLRDGSGDALVDPRDARVSVGVLVTRSSTFRGPDARARAFLASRNFSHRDGFFNKTLRYTETLILPGDVIAVLGAPIRDADPDGAARVTGYRDLPPTRALLRSRRGAPLLITDHPDTIARAAIVRVPKHRPG